MHVAVRQGDGAIYKGPCGEVAVIDVNANRAGDMATALDRHVGTRTIKWMNASHYHADHIGGMRDLATTAGVSVGVGYERGGDRHAYDSATYRTYHDWLAGSGAPTRTQVHIGDVLTLCGGDEQVRFRVLSVGINGQAAGGVSVTNEDDHSVCLRVEYRNFAQATCGDLSGTSAGDRTDVESVVAPDMGRVHVACLTCRRWPTR